MGAGKAAKGERVALCSWTKRGILLPAAIPAPFQKKLWYFSAWDDVDRWCWHRRCFVLCVKGLWEEGGGICLPVSCPQAAVWSVTISQALRFCRRDGEGITNWAVCHGADRLGKVWKTSGKNKTQEIQAISVHLLCLTTAPFLEATGTKMVCKVYVNHLWLEDYAPHPSTKCWIKVEV